MGGVEWGMLHTYHDYRQADPPHQPLYLDFILRSLRADPTIRKVLDAGCGDGNFTASLAGEGFDMYGLDASAGGVARAISRYHNIRFACGSVYDDLAEQCGVKNFDAIVSVEVIEHLYSPQQFVRRAHASLRPGGLFIVTTPYWGYFKNVLLAVTNRMDRALTTRWEGGHIKHYSYKTLRTTLEENGFEYLSFHGAGRSIPCFWMGMAIVARKRKLSPADFFAG
jgi:2-polyprenyl-3-methyl-5-hydroxy-6-metoxy-1,4-benzoquinol methylase